MGRCSSKNKINDIFFNDYHKKIIQKNWEYIKENDKVTKLLNIMYDELITFFPKEEKILKNINLQARMFSNIIKMIVENTDYYTFNIKLKNLALMHYNHGIKKENLYFIIDCFSKALKNIGINDNDILSWIINLFLIINNMKNKYPK